MMTSQYSGRYDDGRKRIVAPDQCEIVPTRKPQPDCTLVKALGRAWRRQRVLEEGHFATLAELAEAERISCLYVCRVQRLTLLTREIVERSSMAGRWLACRSC